MSITDGTRGMVINGHEQPVRFVKTRETDDAEYYDLEPTEAPTPVDQPGPDPAPQAGSQFRPLLPAWATSMTEAEAQAKSVAARWGHTAAYHAIRTPKYAARLASLSPAGAARCIAGTWRWVTDAEGSPVRSAAVRREDAGEYMTLSRQRNDRVKLRAWITAVACAFGVITAAVLYVLAPGWLYAIGSLAVLVLGWVGTPQDKPVIGPAVVVPKAQKLSSEIVLRALGSIGVSGINQAIAKGRPGMAFTAPITRDGPGWRAEGDLPYGVTASDVFDKRDKLASGLRRPLGCVWPEAATGEHTGRLVLWVGDEDMAKARQAAWPLMKAGQVDLFRPAQIGTDQRGRPVSITLMFASMIIGAIPRMGKTFALRLILLLAALDARAEIHAVDFKGTGDLSPLAPIAHAYRAGEEDDDVRYVVADLRELKEELRRRAKVIRSLPKDLCPENKVTPELASNRSLRLHPIVVGIDECQVGFEHPEYGAEIEAVCTDLVKRGPALGIVLILATQRPDAKSLPTGISANAVLRLCLKVMGQVENDMVLGTSSYKNGIRATMFSRSDRGIFYLAGEGDDPRITRGHYVDGPAAERVAERARKARELAGTLSGYALGEQPVDTTPAYDLLADILAVLPAAEEKCWNERLAARLAELRPDVYGGWEAGNVTAALKPHGISAMDVWGTTDDGKGTARRGIERARIVHAMEHRKRA
jgi:S-DNA-T family DNA segregation ATPase FtsK/SpoIIIE